MEPDRGDAGELNGGSLRRMWGRGYPGESLIGTLLCGSYAARAPARGLMLLYSASEVLPVSAGGS